jgi:hypothetical protein
VLATKEQTLANTQLAAATADAALATKEKAVADAEATATAKKQAVASAQSVVATQKQALANAKLTLAAQKQALIEAKTSKEIQDKTLLNAQKAVETEKQLLVNAKTALANERKLLATARADLATEKKALTAAGANVVSKTRIAQLEREVSLTAAKVAATESETIAISQNIRAKQAEIAANARGAVSTGSLTVAKNMLTKATLRLNAALAANKYALITAAVVALGYGIYKLVTYQNQAEKSQKRLNDLNKEYTKSIASERAQIDVLFGRLKAAKEGTKQYETAKKDIMKIADSYNSGLSTEIDLLNDVAGAYDKISRAARQAAKDRAMEKGTKDAADEYAESWEENISKIRKHFLKEFGNLRGEELFQGLKESLEEGGPLSREIEEAISRFNREIQVSNGLTVGGGYEMKTENAIETYIDRIRKSKKILDGEIKEINSIYGSLFKEEENGPEPEKGKDNITEKIAAVRKNISDLNKEIADLRSGKMEAEKGTLEKLIESKLEELAAQENVLKTLTGKDAKKDRDAEKEADKRIAAQQSILKRNRELVLEREKAALEAEQKMLDLEQDSFDKRMQQNELNYKKELQAIREFEAKKVEEQQKAAKDAYVAKKGTDKGFDFSTFDLSELPEGLRKEDIAEQVEAMKVAANKVLVQLNENVLRSLIAQYRDFNAQRGELERQYNEDIEALSLKRTDENKSEIDRAIAERTKVYREGVKDINDAEIEDVEKNSELLKRIFSDASRMSRQRLKEVMSETRKLVNYLKGVSSVLPEGITEEQAEALKKNADEVIEIYDELIEKKEEFEGRQDDAHFSSGLTKWIDKIKEYRKLTQEASEATGKMKDEIKAAAETEFAGIIKEGLGGLIEAADYLSEALDRLANIPGIGDQFADGAEKLSAAVGVLSAAGKGAQSGGWVGAIIGGAEGMITAGFEAYEVLKASEAEAAQNRLDFLSKYQIELLKLKDEDYESIFGVRSIEKSIAAMGKAQEAIRKYREETERTSGPGEETDTGFNRSMGWAMYTGMGFLGVGTYLWPKQIENSFKTAKEAYEKGYNDLQAMAVKTKARGKWDKFWGKQDEYTSLKDLAPELWDENNQFNVEAARVFLETNTQISAEQRTQIEQAIELSDAYDEAMGIIRQELADTFGYLGDEITDTVIDAIKAGEAEWDDFKDAGIKAAETIGKKLMFELFFAKDAEQFQKDLEKLYETETDPEELGRKEMELMDAYFNKLESNADKAYKWGLEWDKRLEEMGYNIWDPEEERQGSKGLAASMTQDQATEMNGFLSNGLTLWRNIASNTGLIMDLLANQDTGNSAELMRN